MHLVAKEYGQRPSSFLGLPPTSWTAYQFDMVVRHAGVQWENAQHETMVTERPRGGAVGKGKPFSAKDDRAIAKPNANWGSLRGVHGVKFTR